jgi:hypothetical protein
MTLIRSKCTQQLLCTGSGSYVSCLPLNISCMLKHRYSMSFHALNARYTLQVPHCGMTHPLASAVSSVPQISLTSFLTNLRHMGSSQSNRASMCLRHRAPRALGSACVEHTKHHQGNYLQHHCINMVVSLWPSTEIKSSQLYVCNHDTQHQSCVMPDTALLQYKW